MPLPRSVAIASYVASALLFLAGSFAGGIEVRTTCSNCLVSIEYPYSLIAFLTTLASIGLLFFGITLSFAILRGRAAKPRRCFVGSVLLSAGVSAVLFALIWFWANWSDEGPRCAFGDCVPSLLQYYQTVYTASAIVAILGLVAAGSGAWLLIRGNCI